MIYCFVTSVSGWTFLLFGIRMGEKGKDDMVEKPWLKHYEPGLPHTLRPYPSARCWT